MTVIISRDGEITKKKKKLINYKLKMTQNHNS